MELALYVHIPFCTKKCPYCDFYSVPGIPDERQYLKALLREIDLVKYHHEELFSEGLPRIKTFYVGGGTPSVFSPIFYEKLLDKLSQTLLFQPVELSIEANPESLTLEKAKGYRVLGFNRISLGIQSFDPRGLKFLQRRHSLREAILAIENVHKAGFENISLDLIYGWRGQGVKTLQKELQLALFLNPSHLSLYELTLYPKTPFFKKYSGLNFLGEKRLLTLANLIENELLSNGYLHYEISNYAKEGFECKHNLSYWKVEPYLGLGAGAVSRISKYRFKNPENIKKYYEYILDKGTLPIIIIENLNSKELIKEKIFMNLRLTEGLNLSEIRGYSFRLKEEALEKLCKKGLLSIDKDNLRLTPKGRFLHQRVVAYLWDNLEEIK